MNPYQAQILGAAWERAASDRLAALLSHAELEELLGELVYTIRRAQMGCAQNSLHR